MSRTRLAIEPDNCPRIDDLDGGALCPYSPTEPVCPGYHQLGVHGIGGGTIAAFRSSAVRTTDSVVFNYFIL